MEKLFNRLLVPFHLWEDADEAIRQAIKMANQLQSDIYLLHFIQGHAPMVSEEEDPLRTAMRRRYQALLDPALSMTIANRQGSAGDGIIAFCRKFNIDLIFLCRKKPSFLKWFPPFFPLNLNRLLRKVECPVLNSCPEQAIPPIKNIVLPVGEHLQVRKLLFATYLARLSHSTIHLVSAKGRQASEGLQRSYRLLRENTDLPVECWALPGQSLAGAGTDRAVIYLLSTPFDAGATTGLRGISSLLINPVHPV